MTTMENGLKEEQRRGSVIEGPTNPMVTPLLTDLYQYTMAYAYWKAGKHNERAVFDLFFRKSPFGGEYTVVAGLEECIRFIANYKFTEDEISFIHDSLPGHCEDGFLDYLRKMDCSDVEVHAIPEGSVVFPRVPLLRVEGPIAVVQLLETTLVNLVNYASLVATNAARHRFVAGRSKILLEFGLRRAQGPDGGISASKYCYIGGFDATSNVAAGKLFGIPLKGTHSHAFVSSFMGPDEIVDKSLQSSDGSTFCEDFVGLVQTWLCKIQAKPLNGSFGETNQSELAAFTSYALAFPNNFLALVDTYDSLGNDLLLAEKLVQVRLLTLKSPCALSMTDSYWAAAVMGSREPKLHESMNSLGNDLLLAEKLVQVRLLTLESPRALSMTDSYWAAAIMGSREPKLHESMNVLRSGIPNFCAVALALRDLGYKAAGIRLDSGDLSYLSCEARKFFHAIEKEFGIANFGKICITASNDLNEETLDHLNKQGHEVDAYGIGTYLVTCYSQAALGCVFKLVDINGQPRIKLSEDVSKVSIPCKKRCYRLYGKEGYGLVDIMIGENEPPPKVGERILCRHPFIESKRAYVVPQQVDELLKCYWSRSADKAREQLPSLKDIRERCMKQLEQMRADHMRRLNPTPYKVSVSAKLYDFIHFLWLNEAPVGELQ